MKKKEFAERIADAILSMPSFSRNNIVDVVESNLGAWIDKSKKPKFTSDEKTKDKVDNMQQTIMIQDWQKRFYLNELRELLNEDDLTEMFKRSDKKRQERFPHVYKK